MTTAAPDILLIMTDQQSATTMSCAGNGDLSTPALDSLARDGVRFTNAYCTNPLCAPSRTSMVSGLLPSQVGVNDNVKTVPEDFAAEETLGRLFSAAGYDCVYAGKWHVPGVRHENEPGDTAQTSGFDLIHAGTHEGLAEACIRHLESRDDDAAPLLMVASFNEPHGICEWARGQTPPSGEVEDPDWRDLPLLPPNFAPGAEEPEALRLIQGFAWPMHPTTNWTAEKWRRYRHAYHRLVERVDAEIGTLLGAWRALVDPSRSLIVMLSDHGDMQAAHQWNQKKQLYEEAAGVPFLVVPPTTDAVPAGQTNDTLVSTGLDLLPSLCDWAGVELPARCAGHSVRPLLTAASDHDRPARDSLVVETVWHFPVIVPPPALGKLVARSIRVGDHKYSCYSWGQHREQLVNLADDPGEMTNLATSGAHQSILHDLRRRLRNHCRDNDPSFAGFIPDTTTPR